MSGKVVIPIPSQSFQEGFQDVFQTLIFVIAVSALIFPIVHAKSVFRWTKVSFHLNSLANPVSYFVKRLRIETDDTRELQSAENTRKINQRFSRVVVQGSTVTPRRL